MALLTIFTPTFNRKDLIQVCYRSLCQQTCKDFVWLIVDDGSSDDTEELVKKWQIADTGFKINYIYKENRGMHTAHNVAYDNIDTELNVCIDSDDYMPPDAVERICDIWNKFKDESLAGLVGLDYDTDGIVIGSSFEDDCIMVTLSGFYAGGGKGDKKLVLRTDVVNQYSRYPEFEGEKLVPLGTLYTLIDQQYKLLTVNSPLVVVDYQAAGSTSTIFRQYRESPQGFSYARIVNMLYGATFKKRYISAVHYVSSSIFKLDAKFLFNSPRKIMTILAIPPGLLLNLYIRLMTR